MSIAVDRSCVFSAAGRAYSVNLVFTCVGKSLEPVFCCPQLLTEAVCERGCFSLNVECGQLVKGKIDIFSD